MDIFLRDYNAQYFLQFFIFGTKLNFISLTIFYLGIFLRILTMSVPDSYNYLSFHLAYNNLVRQNSIFKRLTRALLYFVPMYMMYGNIIFLYYIITNKGSYGLIKGTLKKEEYNILPLVLAEKTHPNQ